MTGDYKTLRRVKKRRDRIAEQLDAAREDLRAAILEANAAGMGQAEIGRVLGWERQRVQQVLDGRR